MKDVSFSPEEICRIPSWIDQTLSPSPNDQTLSPIQVDPTPSPSPINFDPTPSPHEDEVNNVEAQRGICRLKSKIWQHFKKLKSMVWTRLNASIVRNFLVGNQKIEPSICGSIMRFVFNTRFYERDEGPHISYT